MRLLKIWMNIKSQIITFPTYLLFFTWRETFHAFLHTHFKQANKQSQESGTSALKRNSYKAHAYQHTI